MYCANLKEAWMESSTSFLIGIAALALFLYSSAVPWLVRKKQYLTIAASIVLIFLAQVVILWQLASYEEMLIAAWIFTGATLLGFAYDIGAAYLWRVK